MLTNSQFVKYSTFFITLVILIYPSGASAVNYFNWNADSTKTSVGTCINGIFSGAIDTTEKHSGTGSMRIDVENSDGFAGCESGGELIGTGAGNDGTWIYYRWWMKISPSFVWGTGQTKMKWNRVKQSNDNTPLIYTAYFTIGGIGLGECDRCLRPGHAQGDASNPAVAYDFNPTTNSAVTNWQEYIIGVKKQTCTTCQDSQLHLWVNGQEVGTPMTDTRICDASNCSNWYEAWGSMGARPYPQLQSPTPAGGTIWLDDFSFDSTWNSIFSGSAPPQLPLMTPSAPTGLSLH